LSTSEVQLFLKILHLVLKVMHFFVEIPSGDAMSAEYASLEGN
jgi:hypothetical protein